MKWAKRLSEAIRYRGKKGRKQTEVEWPSLQGHRSHWRQRASFPMFFRSPLKQKQSVSFWTQRGWQDPPCSQTKNQTKMSNILTAFIWVHEAKYLLLSWTAQERPCGDQNFWLGRPYQCVSPELGCEAIWTLLKTFSSSKILFKEFMTNSTYIQR